MFSLKWFRCRGCILKGWYVFLEGCLFDNYRQAWSAIPSMPTNPSGIASGNLARTFPDMNSQISRMPVAQHAISAACASPKTESESTATYAAVINPRYDLA